MWNNTKASLVFFAIDDFVCFVFHSCFDTRKPISFLVADLI
jgi:hypothetical protein